MLLILISRCVFHFNFPKNGRSCESENIFYFAVRKSLRLLSTDLHGHSQNLDTHCTYNSPCAPTVRSSTKEIPISKVTPNVTGVNILSPVSTRKNEKSNDDYNLLRLKIIFSADKKESSIGNVLHIKFEGEFSDPENSFEISSLLFTEMKNYDFLPPHSSESSEKINFLLFPNLKLLWQCLLPNSHIPKRSSFSSTYLSENLDSGNNNFIFSRKRENYKNDILSSSEKFKFHEYENEDENSKEDESEKEMMLRDKIEKQGDAYIYNCYGESQQDMGNEMKTSVEKGKSNREEENNSKSFLSLPSPNLDLSSGSQYSHHQREMTHSNRKKKFRSCRCHDDESGSENIFCQSRQSGTYDFYRKVRSKDPS